MPFSNKDKAVIKNLTLF